MCPPGHHHNGFVATHALRNMMPKLHIVYINLPRHAIVRLSYHQGGDRQREESFLAPSAGKKNCN